MNDFYLKILINIPSSCIKIICSEGVCMNFEKIVEKVPRYPYFYTVDELNQRSKELAEKYSNVVSLEQIGASKNGEPINALVIGEGSYNALVFACPHPNEPIGCLTVDFLATVLAENKEFREELNYTWYLVKCADPDGLRLNHGWLKGPFNFLNYSLNFYRPAPFMQVEWTFPIKYKKLNWDKPIPETKALMNVIDKIKPDFMYSLHNAGFGGVYYYVTDECPPLYEPFRKIAINRKLPLSLGEPEVPYAKLLSDGVYKMPTTKETYDYYEKYTDIDPAKVIRFGTGSDDYASTVAKTFTLVTEVPYFYNPLIEDTSPSESYRLKIILDSINYQRTLYEFEKKIFDAVKDYAEKTPIYYSIDEFMKLAPVGHNAHESWAKKNIDPKQKATKAQEFDNLYVLKFYSSLLVGELLRLIDYELMKAQDESWDSKLHSLDKQLRSKLLSILTPLEEKVDYNVIKIKKLVEVQVLSGLYAADYVKTIR